MLVLDKNKTQYLSANSTAPYAMLRGLGLSMETVQAANQFNPEPISKAAIDVITSIQQFFGIGQGRMEADRIVPIQNFIHYNILAPIAEAVNADYAHDLSGSQLRSMLDALTTTETNWLDFLHNTAWTDGRAASQAEHDLAFLFADQEQKLRVLLQDAPYFSNVETPVYTPYTGGPVPTGGGGVIPVNRRTTGGIIPPGGFGATAQSYLPWILAGAFLFMLPKIGKYERR